MPRPLPRRPPNMPDQRLQIRDDLHKIVNDVIDNWETIERQAQEMGRGYPASTLGGEGGSGDTTLVEAQALATIGPGEKATEWLAHLAEFIAHGRTLHDDMKKLLPMTDAEKRRAQQRHNTVEVCTKCGLPADKVRRIDGEPFHADSCYYRVWRANRKDSA